MLRFLSPINQSSFFADMKTSNFILYIAFFLFEDFGTMFLAYIASSSVLILMEYFLSGK